MALAPLPLRGRAAATLALSCLAACKGEPSPAPPSRADLERGYAVVSELKAGLQRALLKAMVDGPVAAVDACSTQAPTITAGAARNGVVVGRATSRPRNPANLATGWQAEALRQFEGDVAAGRRLETARFARRLPDGRIAYAEPLVIQPVCVTCHGAEVGPEIKAALAARYPDDRATGYKVGELRGAIWAELPAQPGS